MVQSATLRAAASALRSLGFTGKRGQFSRARDGLWQVVEFQQSRTSLSRFYINLGVSPVGIPRLIKDRLVVPDPPREYDCIYRKRAEQVCPVVPFTGAESGARYDDLAFASLLGPALAGSAVPFLDALGWSALGEIPQKELNVVPIHQAKAKAVLELFIGLGTSDGRRATLGYESFLSQIAGTTDLAPVAQYLEQKLSVARA